MTIKHSYRIKIAGKYFLCYVFHFDLNIKLTGIFKLNNSRFQYENYDFKGITTKLINKLFYGNN